MYFKATCVGVALFVLPGLTAKAQQNGVRYQIPAVEYNALVDLYNQTGGDNWYTNTGWRNPDATSWFGVEIGDVEYDDGGTYGIQPRAPLSRPGSSGFESS